MSRTESSSLNNHVVVIGEPIPVEPCKEPRSLARAVNLGPPRQRWTGLENTYSVTIILGQQCLLDMVWHAESSLNEVGGFLLGHALRTPDGYQVFVKKALCAQVKSSQTTSITFDADTWQSMIHQRAEHYNNYSVLGWYHTHPNMPVYLSKDDLEIQQHFFDQPWQLALVFNGQNRLLNLFCWDQGVLHGADGFYVTKGRLPPWQIACERGENGFSYRYLFAEGDPQEATMMPSFEDDPELFNFHLGFDEDLDP